MLLVACGGGDEDRIAWRDLTLETPEGWTVFDEAETRLAFANQPLGAEIAEDERPSGDVVAMFLTHRPGVAPGEWREQVETSGAVLEVDAAVDIDGVPATRLQFRTPAGEGTVAIRELVVVVPSREVELFAQPVPLPGTTDAPETFDRHVAAFDAVIDSIRWGAPAER